MNPRILVVEDEPELNRMVCDYLAAHGFAPFSAFDGPSAIGAAFSERPDLVVLDLNLPGVDGLDVARTITSQVTVPIVVTSARGEEEDRLGGFGAGVDDYLVKPFSLPELVARIRAVLRRTTAAAATEQSEAPLVVGDLVVDPTRRDVTVAGAHVSLTAAQFAILQRMARHPGRVYSRLELLESFGDHTYEGYERTIDVHIKNIRKLIEDDPRSPRRLTTVRGAGYRLDTPARTPGDRST